MQLFYVKLPADIAKHLVILVDPMLATGESITAAIRLYPADLYAL